MRVDAGFSHEALLYRGDDDLLARLVPWLRAGVAASEPTLVVLAATKLAKLREALGDDAAAVEFADMGAVGKNPARIIPAWQDFVERHRASGALLRGVGEPINHHRRGPELVECHRHEALLNVALEDAPLWLVCPYDVESLPFDVIEEATRTHPLVRDDDVRSSDAYTEVDRATPFARPLPDPGTSAVEITFGTGPLSELRGFVALHAARAGIDPQRACDLVLAVNEVATNSLRHGGGAGVLRVWREEPWLVCEVRDNGFIDEPLVGRTCPPADGEGGRGLWMANQLCDIVQLESTAMGTAVRLHVRA